MNKGMKNKSRSLNETRHQWIVIYLQVPCGSDRMICFGKFSWRITVSIELKTNQFPTRVLSKSLITVFWVWNTDWYLLEIRRLLQSSTGRECFYPSKIYCHQLLNCFDIQVKIIRSIGDPWTFAKSEFYRQKSLFGSRQLYCAIHATWRLSRFILCHSNWIGCRNPCLFWRKNLFSWPWMVAAEGY